MRQQALVLFKDSKWLKRMMILMSEKKQPQNALQRHLFGLLKTYP